MFTESTRGGYLGNCSSLLCFRGVGARGSHGRCALLWLLEDGQEVHGLVHHHAVYLLPVYSILHPGLPAALQWDSHLYRACWHGDQLDLGGRPLVLRCHELRTHIGFLQSVDSSWAFGCQLVPGVDWFRPVLAVVLSHVLDALPMQCIVLLKLIGLDDPERSVDYALHDPLVLRQQLSQLLVHHVDGVGYGLDMPTGRTALLQRVADKRLAGRGIKSRQDTRCSCRFIQLLNFGRYWYHS